MIADAALNGCVRPLMPALLEVRDLCVDYGDRSGHIRPALDSISFDIQHGEILGILGESGCGKSTLALALLGLLPSGGIVRRGNIKFDGRELRDQTEREMESVRGARISLIFQEPSIALHPMIRVGEQVARVLNAHETLDRRKRHEKAVSVLGEVFSSESERIYSSYPHQLSGGQRQRVLIAQAIACRPALLIADEPTASLDSSTQSEILTLFAALRQKLGIALILISHNPAIISQLADRILVLYAGRVVEEGPAVAALRSPLHPYPRALLRAIPGSSEVALLTHKTKLPAIEGAPPDLSALNHGCRFEPRCIDRMPECTDREPLPVEPEENHKVACFKYGG